MVQNLTLAQSEAPPRASRAPVIAWTDYITMDSSGAAFWFFVEQRHSFLCPEILTMKKALVNVLNMLLPNRPKFGSIKPPLYPAVRFCGQEFGPRTSGMAHLCSAVAGGHPWLGLEVPAPPCLAFGLVAAGTVS